MKRSMKRKLVLKKPNVIVLALWFMTITSIIQMCMDVANTNGYHSVHAQEVIEIESDIVADDLQSAMVFLPVLEVEEVIAEPVAIQIMPSIQMVASSGVTISTNEIQLQADKLIETYNADMEYPEWDAKLKIHTLAVIWEFMVNQQGVPAENVAGLLGNVYIEGDFALRQGTNSGHGDINVARSILGRGTQGYGCVQWTFSKRQRSLLEYYEISYEMFEEDWETTMIVAECCMLLEELKAYEVFDDIYTATSIEDATGRVACIYESYSNSSNQWSFDGKEYHLVSNSGSGHSRLNYAQQIYDYFTAIEEME